MRRAIALVIIVGAVLLVRDQGAGLRTAALAIGFALIAAALVGDLFEHLRLPRVSGYLIFGMVCGPYLADIISRSMARELQVVNGLAIALIAFMAGLEINFSRLKPRLVAIAQLGGATLLVLYVGLLAVFWSAWPWLPIAPEATGLARLALASVLTIVVASFSPTVTIAVLSDTRSRGPLSELTLAVVVLADLALILSFTFVMQLVHWSLGGAAAGEVGLVPRVMWEIVGSLAFGAAIGACFALYLRHVGRELTLVLLGLCVILSGLGPRLDFEPLLAALAAGLVVENIAGAGGEALSDAVERGARPVLVVFFAAAGASLHLDALAAIGGIALAVSGLRLALILGGTHLGARWARVAAEYGRLVWMGLVSQAGVTLGLTIIIASEYPTWGARIEVLLVALISIHELIGPVLFKWALARRGEIGKMDAQDEGMVGVSA
ncbi:MAG TPA: cation:proton antiporter [Vicinamibacterales bacterium]